MRPKKIGSRKPLAGPMSTTDTDRRDAHNSGSRGATEHKSTETEPLQPKFCKTTHVGHNQLDPDFNSSTTKGSKQFQSWDLGGLGAKL